MLARAYSVKIGVIFGVRFERQKVDKKKQTYMKTETCRLYSRDFWIFLPNIYFCQKSSKSISIILSYTVSKLVHFFETQCIVQKHKLYCYNFLCCDQVSRSQGRDIRVRDRGQGSCLQDRGGKSWGQPKAEVPRQRVYWFKTAEVNKLLLGPQRCFWWEKAVFRLSDEMKKSGKKYFGFGNINCKWRLSMKLHEILHEKFFNVA